MTSEKQFTPASLVAGGAYAPSYAYDLVGSLLASTDGVTTPPAQYTSASCSDFTSTWATLTMLSCYDNAERLSSVTSNWNDATHPPNLFSATGGYAPFGGLVSAAYGTPTSGSSAVTLMRGYDSRLRPTSETDTGSATGPATTGSAAVAITNTK